MREPSTDRSEVADVGATLIAELIRGFEHQKELAERALAQLEASQWTDTLDPEANSIAVLVRHLAGNLTSRWTDFLTSDGEKASRDRDGEFEAAQPNPERLLSEWNDAFAILFATLRELTPDDLGRTVTIRGEPHGVIRAILRNYDHTAHHVGQIVMLAKHWREGRWQTLSIPRKRPG